MACMGWRVEESKRERATTQRLLGPRGDTSRSSKRFILWRLQKGGGLLFQTWVSHVPSDSIVLQGVSSGSQTTVAHSGTKEMETPGFFVALWSSGAAVVR